MPYLVLKSNAYETPHAMTVCGGQKTLTHWVADEVSKFPVYTLTFNISHYYGSFLRHKQCHNSLVKPKVRGSFFCLFEGLYCATHTMITSMGIGTGSLDLNRSLSSFTMNTTTMITSAITMSHTLLLVICVNTL